MGHHRDDVLGGLLAPGDAPSVRRAGPADADAAAHVQHRSWSSGYAHLAPAPALGDLAADWGRALADAATLAWVALAGSTLVGVASAVVDGEEAEILALDVDPAHRRHGHGSRLLAAVADHATGSGATLLVTWVLLDDEPRVRFLRSAGLAPDGARRTVEDDAGRRVRLTRLVAALEPA